MSSDFKTVTVNKKVKDFSDKFDLSSPLNSYITYSYIEINGKDGLLSRICTTPNKQYWPDSTAVDS